MYIRNNVHTHTMNYLYINTIYTIYTYIHTYIHHVENMETEKTTHTKMLKLAATSILLTILITTPKTTYGKVDVTPEVADSAAQPGDAPSDRVSVEHLDVLPKASEASSEEETKKLRFRSMPVEQPQEKELKEFYPPPIEQVELERPEDNSQDEMYLNPMGDKTNPGNEMWMDGDSKAFMMSEMRGSIAQQPMMP
jgi:hypothetical protein